MVILQILLITVAALAALFYFGWGLTRFLFPREWNEYELLASPFVGYAVIVTFDYLALFFGINLTYATVALLVIVSLINAFALWTHRRGQPLSSGTPVGVPGTAGVATTLSYPHTPILLISLALFLVTLAPLLRYGYITLIGENWDFEFYLPLAEYLKTYTVAQIANAPPNPLIEVITGRHIGPLPMGFTYLHTTINVLFGFDALDSFVILCGLERALGVISAYVFYRTTLKMSGRASLVAVALYAASGLLLWITFWEFGLHLASLAILPLALALGVRALCTREWRDLPLAALCLAALNVTFHPTLIAALLPLGFIGLYVLAAKPNRIRTLQIGLGLLLLAALFSFPTLFHVEDFRREYYGRTPLATGLRDFIPNSDGFGTSLYTLSLVVGQTIPTPWLFAIAKQVWDVTAFPIELIARALVILAVFRLWRDQERRAVWYLVLAANLIYVLTFRLDFLHPYPYGFLKALTLFVFLLDALIAEGLVQISNFRFQISDFYLFRFTYYSLLIILLASTLFTLGIALEQYFKPSPAFFNADALKIREARSVLPPGAAIFLTDRTDAPRVQMGLASYALHDFPLYGQGRTGYAEYENVESEKVYDFALLARGEMARVRGYQPMPLWSNSLWALYSKPTGLLSHLEGNMPIKPESEEPFLPTRKTIVAGLGDFLQDRNARRASLGLASFDTRAVEIWTRSRETLLAAGQRFTYTISPGITIVHFPVSPLLLGLSLRPDATPSPLYLVFTELWDTDAQSDEHLDTLLALPQTQPRGDSFSTNLRIVNSTRADLNWQFIVRGTPAGRHQEEVFTLNSVQAAPEKSARVEFDPTRGTLRMSFDEHAAKDFTLAPLGDGNYRASLEVFRDNILHSRIELYQWEHKGGQIKAMLPEPILTLIAP